MRLQSYDIDEDVLVEEAQKGSSIAIKLPDGLIPDAVMILEFLKRNGIQATLLAESCYGACDFTFYKGIDRIICIGEAPMPYLNMTYQPPVSFIEPRYEFDVSQLIIALPLLKGENIGLASITPFVHNLQKCATFLEQKGFRTFIGHAGRRTTYDGQILGCDFSAALSIANTIDTFLFIGDGMFHPVGLRMATQKSVVAYNPLSKRAYADEISISADRYLKQRYAAVARAMDARRFGIIVTEKIGQRRMELAKNLQQRIRAQEKEAFIILCNTVSLEIEYLNVDCFVSTACPRIAIDDSLRYKKPILTPVELDILFGLRTIEQYEFDQIL